MERSAGILLPVFSLPGPYGIGSLGREARAFAEFLHDAGQRWWQVLPVGPTGAGNSPYTSESTFAGNPLLIDLEDLRDRGLLTEAELSAARVDRTERPSTTPPCMRAGRRCCGGPSPGWAARRPSPCGTLPPPIPGWGSTPCTGRSRPTSARRPGSTGRTRPCGTTTRRPWRPARQELAEDIAFHEAVQFWFFSQWKALKDHANGLGVRIIGDLPIYVSLDSADVWSERREFLLDEAGRPSRVAGVPPDYFSEEGQLWGNPLYDWAAHEAGRLRLVDPPGGGRLPPVRRHPHRPFPGL